jgi:hypothetical protein
VKRWRGAYLAAVLVVLAWHFRLALPGRALVSDDFRTLFIPLRACLQNTLREGSWPFWQRGMFFGYPIPGDIQIQLFNPLTWLTLPLHPARGITLQSVIELCLCSAGMAFWMKQRGLKAVEAVFAGATFALCLKQTVHLHHSPFAASTCAWPWMLAGLDGFAATGRIGFVALTALATAGTWIGGSPQMAYFGTGLAFLYSLALAPELLRRSREHAAAGLCAVPLGVALAAPLLLPVHELNAFGPRGAGVTYHFASSWSWPDRSVWTAMLLPRAWGGRAEFRGPMNYWELQGYLGLLPMALLLAAPLRRRRNWLLVAVAALGIWISFGEHAWLDLHRFAVRWAPGYGGFRVPTRALMLTAFCVAALAAEGLGRLREEPRARWLVLAGLAALALCVGLAAASPQGYFVRALRDDAEAAFWLLAGCAVWTAFARADWRWAAAAIPLFAADVAVQCWDSPEIGPAWREARALEPLAPSVPEQPQPRRVAAVLQWENANAVLTRGWEGVTGYGPTAIERVLRLFEATWTGTIPAARPISEDKNFPHFRTDSPLTPLFGAPLIVADREASVPPIARDGAIRLYRLPALPRVFWTGAWRAAPDERSFFLLAQAASGTVAVLAEPIVQPSGAPAGPVAAERVEVRANEVVARLTAPADGLAVLLDPWFPGWRLSVDGAAAPLLRANFLFMATPLKAGDHTLRLTYFPTRLLAGVGVALVAAALLVLLGKLSMHRVDTPPPGGYFPPP